MNSQFFNKSGGGGAKCQYPSQIPQQSSGDISLTTSFMLLG